MAYDARERVSSVTDALGVTRLAYNDVGRVTAIDGPWDNDTVRYTYDNIGRKSGASVDGVAGVGGQSNAYAYDTLGRLDTITTQAGLFDYNYSSLGKQGEMLMPNGTKATYAYDTLDRLTSVAHWAGGANPATATPLWRNSYAHEEAPYALRGVQTSALQEAQGQPSYKQNFAYSNDDQLTGALTQKSAGANWQNERSQSFAYDAMGNRTSSGSTDVAGVRNTSYTANALNQLTALNTTVDAASSRSQLDYDKTGNLTSAASYTTTGGANTPQGRTVYEYDDIDRLSAVETRDASDVKQHRTEWVYDSASRKRIARDADWQNGAWTNEVEKRFVFDGLEVVQERDQTNAVKSDLVWAGAVGGLLSRTRYTQAGPQKRFYHYDGGGNVIGLSDATGAVTARYRYDVYGNTLEAAGVDAGENPVRWGTKWQHGAGGLNLERIHSNTLLPMFNLRLSLFSLLP